jgi:hypothetical protein
MSSRDFPIVASSGTKSFSSLLMSDARLYADFLELLTTYEQVAHKQLSESPSEPEKLLYTVTQRAAETWGAISRLAPRFELETPRTVRKRYYHIKDNLTKWAAAYIWEALPAQMRQGESASPETTSVKYPKLRALLRIFNRGIRPSVVPPSARQKFMRAVNRDLGNY